MKISILIRLTPLILALFFTPALNAQDSMVDSESRSAIIDEVCKALNETYIFLETAQEMEKHLRTKLKKGAYDEITDLGAFTQALTNDLRAKSKDLHLAVMPLQPINPNRTFSPEEERKQRRKMNRARNYGFNKVEILPGNVGYLDLRMFADASVAGPTAIAALNFLANTDSIIIDLRSNGGGSPSMIQLISSYFFDEPKHLNSFYVRKSDSTQQFWTQAVVQGKKLVDTPLYVLTSRYTFSAAEEFTYNLKNMERATIVGETTGGGAHPVNSVIFEDLKVMMSLPYGRAINPITKTNWEGVGISPHISVSRDKALLAAQKDALTKISAKETSPLAKNRINWALMTLNAKMNPVYVEKEELKAFAGTYGPRTIQFKRGQLIYKRAGGQPFHLIPMGDDAFQLKGLDFFRIKFNRDPSGAVTELVGMYDDGRVDANPRMDG